jgi:hypothetical protein
LAFSIGFAGLVETCQQKFESIAMRSDVIFENIDFLKRSVRFLSEITKRFFGLAALGLNYTVLST